MASSPTVRTIKALFALSGNACAFPDCDTPLIDPKTGTVIGEICHLNSRRRNGPRFDEALSEDECNDIDRLILMCPIHHKVIDDDPDSYSVERLSAMKKSHEARVESGVIQSQEEKIQFLQLLDERIQGVIEREKASASDLIIKAPTAILGDLARKARLETKRKEWRGTAGAARDVQQSAADVFDAVDKYYLKHSDDLTALGIQKKDDETYFRSIYDGKVISQVLLDGVDKYAGFSDSSVELRIEVYRTRPAHQPGLGRDRCYTDIQLRRRYKPNINFDGQVVWNEVDGGDMNQTPEQLAEKVFELFIETKNESRDLTENVPGGRYLVNGEYVDAWGKPLDSADDDWE